jgi:Tfp pilus assembly protein PilF
MSADDDRPCDLDEPRSILAQFRAGVGARISASDVETHFELGVAYVEMGLVADATHEFETVLRAKPGHARARAALVEACARRLRSGTA